MVSGWSGTATSSSMAVALITSVVFATLRVCRSARRRQPKRVGGCSCGTIGTGLRHLPGDLLDMIGAIMPAGPYEGCLLQSTPQLTMPGTADDYFAKEQVATWGLDSFWGLPHDPRTEYYRLGNTPIPPGWPSQDLCGIAGPEPDHYPFLARDEPRNLLGRAAQRNALGASGSGCLTSACKAATRPPVTGNVHPDPAESPCSMDLQASSTTEWS
jgi:hypothetical protein